MHPLIVTAQMGKNDQVWADAMRQTHFPPERNFLPAHITLFHHLPPQHEGEIRHRLALAARENAPPEATLKALMPLGRGVAFEVQSPELLAIRMELSDALHGLLVPQDMGTPKLHITIQNKVEPVVAKALLAQLSASFQSRPLAIRELVLWRYLGGPWEQVQSWRFSGLR
ncbi:MAG: 2'-5' RNA ligase family protein [Sphingomonadales bacterium]|nr:2'-5' RNA ligase family protein [Sphingomonadales bacterium]